MAASERLFFEPAGRAQTCLIVVPGVSQSASMRKITFWLLLVLFATLACSSGARDEDVPGPGEEPDTGTVTGDRIDSGDPGAVLALPDFRPPRPANSRIEVDVATSATRLIGRGGDTIEATGSDGTIYVLTFPADAVLLDTLITVTPIVSATGGPLAAGSTAYGVRIEPDDAQLFGVATLEITPAVSIGAVAAFSSESGGENVHFDLIDLRTDTLLLPITHFSDHFVLEVGQITEVKPEPAPAEGAVEVTVGEITEVKPEPAPAEGAAEVTVGEITEVKPEPAPAEGAVSGGSGTSTTTSWTPEGAGEQLANEVGKLLADERERQQRGEPPDPELFDELQSLSDEFYTRLIEPYVDQWPTNCFVAKLTVPLALSWARQRQLLGIDDDVRYDHVWAQMVLGLENCVRELIDPCLQPKDVSEFFGYMRQLELLGGEHAYSDLDFEDVLCGEIYGVITKHSVMTPLTTVIKGAESGGPVAAEETVTAWFSIAWPFDQENWDPAASTAFLEVRGTSRSEYEGECGLSYWQTDWNGSVAKPASLRPIYGDDEKAELELLDFLPQVKAVTATRQFDRDCNAHDGTTLLDINWNLSYGGELLVGKVSPDRLRIDFDLLYEGEFNTWENHQKVTITGTLISKTPLTRWD